MRKQIVFVEGGRVESVISRVLVRLGVKSVMFMPKAIVQTSESFSLPRPPLGSTLQAEFNQVLEWCFDQVHFIDRAIGVIKAVVGSSNDGTFPPASEITAALVGRSASSLRVVALAEHFWGNERANLIFVCRSRRQSRALREVFGFQAVQIPRLPSMRKLLNKTGFRDFSNQTERTLSSKLDTSPEIVLLEHQGSSYSRLFSWTQYDGGDKTPPLFPGRFARIPYRTLGPASLRPSQRVRCLVASMLPMFKMVPAIRKASPKPGVMLVFELARLAFEIRASRQAIRQVAPRLKVALFAYDMLVPPGLAIALGVEDARRIATLERQNAHLTGLPVIVDDWLVPSQQIGEFLASGGAIAVKRVIPVGFWRSDFFFRNNHQLSEDPNCDVLVLPYPVNSPTEAEYWDLVTSPSAFTHFIASVIKVSQRYPHLEFVIRTKDDHWFEDHRLSGCRDLIESQSNLRVDLRFDYEGQAYARAAQAQLVIGKYTSLMDECLFLGKPVVVHNFDHFGSHQFGIGDLPLPWSRFAQSQEQFETLVDFALQGSLGPTLPEELCDGNVRHRIRRFVEHEFNQRAISDVSG